MGGNRWGYYPVFALQWSLQRTESTMGSHWWSSGRGVSGDEVRGRMVNPRIATEELNDFSGGLNLVRDPHRLRDNEVQEAQNCIFRSGLPEKRDGIAEYNSTELTPNSSDIKGIVRGNLAKCAACCDVCQVSIAGCLIAGCLLLVTLLRSFLVNTR